VIALTEARDIDLIALDDALNGLSASTRSRAASWELRFFGSLSIEETADAQDFSRNRRAIG
jgi:hypothetical protein